MSAKPELTVCMIVKNEADRLAEALSSFRAFADEIVVVDTGSTDRTKAVASRFTTRVFDFPWVNDFSAARNHSIARARGRYVLWLDADDRIDEEMAARINRLKSYFDGSKAFYFLLESVEGDGRPVQCLQLRCLPRHEKVRFRGRIHEQIFPSAVEQGLVLARTDIVVRHVGYKDPELHRKKLERNLSLLEQEISEGSQDGGPCFFLALTHEGLGHDQSAIAAMEQAITFLERKDPDRELIVEGLLFLGRIHARSGNPAASLRSAVRAEALAGGNPQHHLQLGLLYQQLGRHIQALGCFERSLHGPSSPGLYPSHPLPARGEILLLMAYSLFCMNRGPEAIEAMNAAQKLGMDPRRGWELLAMKAMDQDNPRLAVQLYETLERSQGLEPDGYCNLGTLYKRLGLGEKTLRCYQAALGLDPGHESSLANLAHYHLAQGNRDGAQELFHRLMAQGVRDIDILLGAALIAAQKGDTGRLRTLEQQIADTLAGGPAKGAASPTNRSGGRFFSELSDTLSVQGKSALARMARAIADALCPPSLH